MPLRLGVNLAGAEFGETVLPGVEGRDYVFNSEATIHYFVDRGITLFRVPFLWERIQPVLYGPLDGAYLEGLQRSAGFARRNGSEIVLDLHNFGRYRNGVIGSAAVPRDSLADVWRRLSSVFTGAAGIWAYGLMNEPHDMGDSDWKAISQAAVDSIRSNRDPTRILIPGLQWSNAHVWARVNGDRSWISDPATNLLYEAHVYFDRDGSGRYQLSYDEELRLNPGLPKIGPVRLSPFIEWLQRNREAGFIGEFGVPDSDPRWLQVLDTFLDSLSDDAGACAYLGRRRVVG